MLNSGLEKVLFVEYTFLVEQPKAGFTIKIWYFLISVTSLIDPFLYKIFGLVFKPRITSDPIFKEIV